jgi:glycosyltransferase involved in cell wall biosynthesis
VANQVLNNTKISIVSPVYQAEGIVPELVKRITEVCRKHNYDFEIILVDDYSRDNSWQTIKSLAIDYPELRGYKLSKNFGQHYAITAGIAQSTGDLIVVMDCDLQDNPEYIPELISKANEGYHVVCTIKKQKRYSLYRRIASDLFFKIINNLSDIKLENGLGTMTLLKRQVADEYLKIQDYHRHSSMIFSWLGFKRGYVEIEHDARYSGKSSYNLKKLIRHAVNGVISQSDKLLRWSITLGLIMFIASLMGVIFIVVKSFFHQFEVGWPSLVVLILFTTGILLLMLGILGLYIGKIFEQVKQRPLFIIEETTLK